MLGVLGGDTVSDAVGLIAGLYGAKATDFHIELVGLDANSVYALLRVLKAYKLIVVEVPAVAGSAMRKSVGILETLRYVIDRSPIWPLGKDTTVMGHLPVAAL
jgi:hypothetical protein